jgi:hypothetical protein
MYVWRQARRRGACSRCRKHPPSVSQQWIVAPKQELGLQRGPQTSGGPGTTPQDDGDMDSSGADRAAPSTFTATEPGTATRHAPDNSTVVHHRNHPENAQAHSSCPAGTASTCLRRAGGQCSGDGPWGISNGRVRSKPQPLTPSYDTPQTYHCVQG